ncbi:hypothetical protein V496_03747 [Pseudogymnoascus sp. VKM F-4515 (FW-2607)]|nr:hypothetical protein V496_03747 [Pseudogymnoascus sp. VKM F-4515 (FW-2607)]
MSTTAFLFQYVPFSSIQFVLVVAICVFIHWNVQSYLRLRHVPGPWLAAWTNIPRLLWVASGNAHDIHLALHRKYGDIVRFGPNMISVQDPAQIGTIYSIHRKFAKSDFYHVLLFYLRGKPVPTIFATQDEDQHHTLRRPIAAIYSMSNVVSFEPYVDSTMSVFIDQLNKRFVEPDLVCNFGTWLQMFAFDVMGEITFSRRLGFLESGTDIDGLMQHIWAYFKKAAPITQMPWLDSIWTKNPIVQYLKAAKPNAIVGFALAQTKERLEAEKEKAASDSGLTKELNNRDFLSRFLEALEKDKSIPPWALMAWSTSNVTAGSDTTAILLRTIFYNLLKSPSTMKKLLDELSSTIEKGSSEFVTWKESRELPYLDACIKEAGRMHPPFGLPLERVVPEGGAEICGKFLVAGTVVGMGGSVTHRHKETFGDDCDVWRPERWLCDKENKRRMENSLLTFGAGHRVCLGKNISYLEVYKVVPTLLRIYEFSFADPDCNKWKVENFWFTNQTGLNIRIKRRTQ